MKTVDFSETIAASDVKVSRNRHPIDYVKICEYCMSRSGFLTLANDRVYTKFKLDFLRNHCADLNQSLYESFQIQGNENPIT